VVAINNDDIQTVVDELGQELLCAIVPLYTEGFKSKSAVTGFDTALHALVKHLAGERQEEQEEFINLLSVTESRWDREEIGRLLGVLGITVNTIPDGARAADFARAARARYSLSLNADYGDYLGKVLENDYGVTYLHPPRPIGIAGTDEWLAAVSEAVGTAGRGTELHERESAALHQELTESPLKGARVYVSLPAATAFGVVNLVEELGGEAVGVTVEHLDRLHETALAQLQEKRPEFQIHVAHGQSFEEVNILVRLAPDLYVGASGHQADAGRLGIPVVSLNGWGILGYRGVTNFARQSVKALKNRTFVRTLAQIAPLPYQESWYRRSPNWHIKQEVK
jgi:nitrogenase molybdenum-iron protein alpha/beta subunit